MGPPLILVGNLKGGVGKTFVAGNLASTYARRGLRILLIDLDPQASLTSLLRHVDDGDLAGYNPHSADYRWVQALCKRRSPLPHALRANKGGCPDSLRLLPSGAALSELNTILQIQANNVRQWQEYLPTLQSHLGYPIPSEIVRAIRKTHAGLYEPLDERDGVGLGSLAEDPALAANYDAVIIDSPPTITAILVEAMAIASHILMVTTPDASSRRSLTLFLNELGRVDPAHGLGRISGIVINRAHKRREDAGEIAQIRAEAGKAVCEQVLYEDVAAHRSNMGRVLGMISNYAHSRKMRRPAILAALDALADELAPRLRLPAPRPACPGDP